ncbi:MAG TPA: nitroreductase family protein, partial [Steroidobacteraceae bacterium]
MSDGALALEALLSRRSVPALQLRQPGPTAGQVDLAIDAALRAPDHGGLRPCRFVLIRGAARARLSELFVRRLQQREPATPLAKIEKARNMPLTAPLVIAVGAHLRSDH